MSSFYIDNIVDNITMFSTIKAPFNTKGTLYINNGTQVDYQAVGADGQYLVSDQTEPLHVKWVDAPTGITEDSTTILVASIKGYNGQTSYSCFNTKSESQWTVSKCEALILGYNSKIKAISICVSNNDVWTINPTKTINFTLGKLTGIGDISLGGVFTDYIGTGVTTTVDSTNNNTRNVITSTCDINVLAGDEISVKSVDDGTGVSNSKWYTVSIWIRSTFN